MKNKATRKILLLVSLSVIAAICAVYAFCIDNVPQRKETWVRVAFLSVGNADCAVIECDGGVFMVDTGHPDKYTVIEGKLRRLGIKKVDAIILSHLDTDHSGNAENIKRDFSCDTLYTAKPDTSEIISKRFNDLKKAFSDVRTVKAPTTLDILGLEAYVLGPLKEERTDNSSSIVMKLIVGENSILFTGDAEISDEVLMVDTYGDLLDSDILKAPHHGASLTEGFLNAVDPSYAVISTGYNNYGHPSSLVTTMITDWGTKLHITESDKDAVFILKGDRISYKACRI